jgi:hypothetical protein
MVDGHLPDFWIVADSIAPAIGAWQRYGEKSIKIQ